MPFRKRGLTMFRDWEPDEHFDPSTDRLLVTTSWGEAFVARANPENDDSSSFVIDKAFMPDNLTGIPRQLKLHRSLPLEWDASAYPWEVFLYDSEMTSDGLGIEMMAVGTGWSLPIRTSLTIAGITPILLRDIRPKRLARDLGGLSFGEFNVRDEIMWNEAMRL
jgi:hypothetical protein